MPRGRNRRSRKEDTHDRGSGQPARHPAGLTHLTTAGESIHAPVRAGMEEARAGAKPRLSHRISNFLGGIHERQNLPDLAYMLWVHPSRVVVFEEPPQPFMLKALDHCRSSYDECKI